MQSPLKPLLALAALTLTMSACSRDQAAGNIDIKWQPDNRSYTAIVADDDGTNWVEINCRYVGKQPHEPVEREISRDWKTQDTDFYHFELINLLGETIELQQLSLRLDKGKKGRVYQTKPQSEIEKELGSYILEANGSLERRNSWVYGLADANVLHKIYQAKSGQKTVQVDTHLVYRR